DTARLHGGSVRGWQECLAGKTGHDAASGETAGLRLESLCSPTAHVRCHRRQDRRLFSEVGLGCLYRTRRTGGGESVERGVREVEQESEPRRASPSRLALLGSPFFQFDL